MRYLLSFVLLAACSHASPRPQPPAPAPTSAGPPATVAKTTCDAGDEAIASSSSCLQDDAACYQLADGSWCTGGRPHGNWNY